MAPHVTTVLTVARTGARVVRYLIRPAVPGDAVRLHTPPDDAWNLHPTPNPLTRGGRLRRGAHVIRRGAGLTVLLVIGVLGALLLLPLLLILAVGAASGSDVSGILLGLTLLIAAAGTYWTARRATRLLHTPPPHQTPPGPTTTDEQALLTTLRTHERALPNPARAALHATVIATRDALRAHEHDTTLSREAFDARQAAREDLPELLAAWQGVPRTSQNDTELLQQLRLIEQRMQTVVRARAAQDERTLRARRHYLQDKYDPERQG